MDQTELINTIQSHLDSKLSVAVRTRNGTEDERPVPAVILEDVDITDIRFHNTHLAQAVENDSAGTADERYFRFHYWARLDYLVRHENDFNASTLRDQVRHTFQPLEENPRSLDNDLNEVNLRGGGGFTGSGTEDSESEMNQAVMIRSFHQMKNTEDAAFDSSTLDEIQNKLDAGYGDDFTVS